MAIIAVARLRDFHADFRNRDQVAMLIAAINKCRCDQYRGLNVQHVDDHNIDSVRHATACFFAAFL